jgi:hypothetical protein
MYVFELVIYYYADVFYFFIFGSSGYLILDLVKLMKSLMQFSFGNHLILKF